MSATIAKATALVDADARRRIAEDLDTTFVVEAAAGTGKTTALVSRIVGLFASGRARASSLVAATFTEKAAGELVVKTREALEDAWRTAAPESAEHRRLGQAIRELETARIGTIHGLATDLLRELPIEAGLDPMFRVLAEEEAAELLDRVTSRWLEERLAAPTPAIRHWLRRPPTFPDTFRTALVRAVTRLAEQRDLDATWESPTFDREARITAVVGALERLRPLLAEARASKLDASDNLFEALDGIVRALDESAIAEHVASGRDLDGVEATLVRLSRFKLKRGKRKMFGKRLRAEVLAEVDRATALMVAFRNDADGALAASLQPELRDAVARYEAEKRRLGVVDYTDLLFELRRVLAMNATVRATLQRRFSHVLVDEVQDTDPMQYEIVRLLVADDASVSDPRAARPVPGKLFVVGDPKQAIYRFRRADLDAYFENRGALVAAGAEILHLRTSFRAEPSIQAAVNHALGGGVSGHALPEYVALAPHRPARTDRPSVLVLPVPHLYGDWGVYQFTVIGRSCAEAVGALVADLISTRRWTVQEDGREVPLEARHVAILFKRTTSWGDDLVAPYARALERRGVPIRSAERKGFFEREEIFALRTVLSAIEWIDDELSAYCGLRGPYVGFSDAGLLSYLRGHGWLHPLRVPKKDGLAPGAKRPAGEDVADALRLLRSLHVARNQRPIADTITRFLEATRAHALWALTPHGERAVSNLGHFTAIARRAEARGVLSFRRFVEELEARIEDGQQGEVTTEDDSTHGVTLSTVHGAKGLEFPVVILADPTAPRSNDNPGSFTDRAAGLHVERIAQIAPLALSRNAAAVQQADEEEARRLLYVAATRARDLLVVPSGGDGPFSGWTEPLERALRPARGTRPMSAPGCPPLGEGGLGHDTVLDRPDRVAEAEPDTVAPGLYRFGGTDHAVVWWGPAALALESSAPPGVREIDLLTPPDRSGNDGGAERAKALALARARRLDRVAPAGESTREPLSVLADKPLAIASIELDVEEVAVSVDGLAARDDYGTRKLESLVSRALVVQVELARDASGADLDRSDVDPVAYVARALASRPEDVRDATAILAAIAGSAELRASLAQARSVRTDVWVALSTSMGSLGEGRVPIVIEREDETIAISVALAGELASSRARELGLAATALARDTAGPVRALLFVVGA